VKDIWPLKTPLSLLLLPSFTLPGIYKRGTASARYAKEKKFPVYLCIGKIHSAVLHSFEHGTSGMMWT